MEFEKGDLDESYGLDHIQYVKPRIYEISMQIFNIQDKSLIYKINLYKQVNSRSIMWRFLKPRTLSISFSSVVISTLPQGSNLWHRFESFTGGSSYKYVIVRVYEYLVKKSNLTRQIL
jgi:hypothetical protein